jgi:hypothetical protein
MVAVSGRRRPGMSTRALPEHAGKKTQQGQSGPEAGIRGKHDVHALAESVEPRRPYPACAMPVRRGVGLSSVRHFPGVVVDQQKRLTPGHSGERLKYVIRSAETVHRAAFHHRYGQKRLVIGGTCNQSRRASALLVVE